MLTGFVLLNVIGLGLPVLAAPAPFCALLRLRYPTPRPAPRRHDGLGLLISSLNRPIPDQGQKKERTLVTGGGYGA